MPYKQINALDFISTPKRRMDGWIGRADGRTDGMGSWLEMGTERIPSRDKKKMRGVRGGNSG